MTMLMNHSVKNLIVMKKMVIKMVMNMVEMILLEDWMKEIKLDNICIFFCYLIIILLLVYCMNLFILILWNWYHECFSFLLIFSMK